MCGKSKKQWPECIGITAAAAALAFLLSIEGIAAGDIVEIPVATSGDAMAVSLASPAVAESSRCISSERKSKGKDESILSVELPVVAEEEPSPFDFFLDPCSLIYETDAMRYGGGTVEEGATLLFCNREGEYAFSSCSDKLQVIGGEGEPVLVTVSASVSDMEGIALVEQEELSGHEEPCIYLALTDGHGNEQPIFQDTKATVCMELNTGAYSFGLTGACNEGADWQDISVCPKVRVTWHVEPALIEDEDEEESEMEEEILLVDDVTGQETVRRDPEEMPADDAASRDGETGGITKPEAFDSISGSSDPPAGKDGGQGAEQSAGKDGGQGAEQSAGKDGGQDSEQSAGKDGGQDSEQSVGKDNVHGQDSSGGGAGYQSSPKETAGNVSGQNSPDNLRKDTDPPDRAGKGMPKISGSEDSASEAG